MKRRPHFGIGLSPAVGKLGKFLRKRRLAIGLSLRDVHKFYGVRFMTVSHLERGEQKSMNSKIRSALSLAYGVSEQTLMNLEPREKYVLPKAPLGRLIKQARLRLDIGRVKFAAKAGINFESIMAIENGSQRTLSFAQISKLAQVLGINPKELTPFVKAHGRQKPRGNSASLGRFVTHRRLKLGLSQKQLAEKLEKTRQYVSLIELGKITLCNSSIVGSLVAALEVDESELRQFIRKRKIPSKPFDDKTLGGFLRKTRYERGISQEDLARTVNLSREQMSHIESNKSIPHLLTLEKIVTALNCRVPRELLPDLRRFGALLSD